MHPTNPVLLTWPLAVVLAAPALAGNPWDSVAERAVRTAEKQLDKHEPRAAKPARSARRTSSPATAPAPPSEGKERSFQLYAKPARENLAKAHKLAGQIAAAKDLAPFEAAKGELAAALKRLREMKTWSGAAESSTVRELETAYLRTCQEVYVAAEPKLVEKLAAVEGPKDVYKGADQQKIRDEVLAEWKRSYPQDEVLAVRLPMEIAERQRERVWRQADKAWVETDKSTLRVSVIVRTTPKIASIYPAYVNTNNLSGRVNYGTNTKSGGYVVQEILAAKVVAD